MGLGEFGLIVDAKNGKFYFAGGIWEAEEWLNTKMKEANLNRGTLPEHIKMITFSYFSELDRQFEALKKFKAVLELEETNKAKP